MNIKMAPYAHNFLALSLAVTVTASIGCVTAGKHQTLQDEHTKLQEVLARSDAERSELERKLGITRTEKSQLEGSVLDMRQALADAEARKLETEKRLAEFRALTQKFKSMVDAGKLSIRVRNGKMTILLSSDVLFASGSAILSSDGKKAIQEVSGVLKDLSGKKFQIEGHTDSMPIRTKLFPSNWELASARAMSVLNTMLSDGGLPSEQISAASYGSTEPVGDNQSDAGRAENRRIAIVVVPDLSALPGFDELNRLSEKR